VENHYRRLRQELPGLSNELPKHRNSVEPTSIRVSQVSRSRQQKQRLKSSLHEVMVAGQRLRDASLSHYLETDAISQRPCFIGTTAIKRHSPTEPGLDVR
jgi:hypothetical protein